MVYGLSMKMGRVFILLATANDSLRIRHPSSHRLQCDVNRDDARNGR